MIFAGIDLAASPAKTGVARLEETSEGPSLIDVSLGATDRDLATLIQSADLTGIDVPLGWPRAFREAIDGHAVGRLHMAPSGEAGADWRRGLVNRFTDLEVRRIAGVVPLPVAAERIAYPALRWAAIEARLRFEGLGGEGMGASDLDRSGAGKIAEVYPAAALKQWGLTHRGYKGADPGARRLILEALEDSFALQLGGFEDRLAANADCLDAAIAAVVAREIRAGRCVPPPVAQAELVAEEGWIWIPDADKL